MNNVLYEFYFYRGELKRRRCDFPTDEMLREAKRNQSTKSLQGKIYSFDPTGKEAKELYAGALEEKAQTLDRKAGEIQGFIDAPVFEESDAVNLGSFIQARRKEKDGR